MRPTAVAGRFYPKDREQLAADVDRYVRQAGGHEVAPKAIVVPHAAYRYSGPVAGHGYATLSASRGTVRRVVLVGPAHLAPVGGLATVSVDALDTPLGPVTVDADLREAALRCPGVVVDDRAHASEHSLEVHLPFIARALGDVSVLPLVVGGAPPEAVAAVLEVLWGGPETLVVVSTDLSHFLDHTAAAERDRRTAARVVDGDADAIANDDACGATGLRGLLLTARDHGLRTRLLDLRSSGDTAGPRDRVVGYAAFALVDDAPSRPGQPVARPLSSRRAPAGPGVPLPRDAAPPARW